jgi:hypothetical protein
MGARAYPLPRMLGLFKEGRGERSGARPCTDALGSHWCTVARDKHTK